MAEEEFGRHGRVEIEHGGRTTLELAMARHWRAHRPPFAKMRERFLCHARCIRQFEHNAESWNVAAQLRVEFQKDF